MSNTVENQVTDLIAQRHLSPDAWPWIGIDANGVVCPFQKEPIYDEIDEMYLPNNPSHLTCHIGTIQEIGPRLFRFESATNHYINA